MRGTVVMTLDGNHVQIPNSMVYKSTIRNYTANPRFRRDFAVGISYADSIAHAQEIAMRVLRGHEGVVSDPEPLVLVESLGSSAVQLRILFWVDITIYSDGKVLSAVMRHVKQAFQDARISMPDEAREVIFPEGIPVRMLSEPAGGTSPHDGRPRRMQASRRDNERASSQAEGNLTSDAAAIQKQAAESRLPDDSENLIAATPAKVPRDEDPAK